MADDAEVIALRKSLAVKKRKLEVMLELQSQLTQVEEEMQQFTEQGPKPSTCVNVSSGEEVEYVDPKEPIESDKAKNKNALTSYLTKLTPAQFQEKRKEMAHKVTQEAQASSHRVRIGTQQKKDKGGFIPHKKSALCTLKKWNLLKTQFKSDVESGTLEYRSAFREVYCQACCRVIGGHHMAEHLRTASHFKKRDVFLAKKLRDRDLRQLFAKVREREMHRIFQREGYASLEDSGI